MQAKQYGAEVLYNALLSHMQDPDRGMYYPNMANIAAQITGTKKQNTDQLETKATMQWQRVKLAISECGRYNAPKFADPVTTACVTSMGWINLCALNTSELDGWHGLKRFTDLYEKYSTVDLDMLPSNIRGLVEQSEDRQQNIKALGAIVKKLQG